MHLDENKIAENWGILIDKINLNFKGERKDKLIEMYTFFQDRMMLMPASSFEHFHNCFAGGYVDHIGLIKYIRHGKIWVQIGQVILMKS